MQVFLCFYNLFADLWHISVNKYTLHQLFGFSLWFNSHSLRFLLMRLINLVFNVLISDKPSKDYFRCRLSVFRFVQNDQK